MSEHSDAEVKRADGLPGSLLRTVREDLVEHALRVQAVVEDERTDRRGDAQTAAGGVAKIERVHPAWIGPEIAGFDEHGRLHVAAERNAQLEARIDEGVAATDDDFAHVELAVRVEQ